MCVYVPAWMCARVHMCMSMHICTCTCVCMSTHTCVHVFITIFINNQLNKKQGLVSCYKIGAIKGAITAKDQGVLGVTSHLSRKMPPAIRNPSLSPFSKGSPTTNRITT